MAPHEIVAAVVAVLGAIGAGTWISSLLLRRQYRAAVRQLNASARNDEATAGRTEAELTQILQGAAAESVKWATDQLTAAREDLVRSREEARQREAEWQRDREGLVDRIKHLEERQERHERDRERQRELLGEHAAWDFIVIERLRAAGIDIADITPPPPLLLPHR